MKNGHGQKLSFTEHDPKEFVGNFAQRLEKDWILVAAGTEQSGTRVMTISWGGFGYIWNRSLAVIAIRKSRHTLPFIEANQAFSLGIFSPDYKEKLTYCGRNSGKTTDKVAHCGFTTAYHDGVPFFAESDISVICRIMYADEIKESEFVEKKIIDEWYRGGAHEGDLHRVFYASIQTVLQNPKAKSLL